MPSGSGARLLADQQGLVSWDFGSQDDYLPACIISSSGCAGTERDQIRQGGARAREGLPMEWEGPDTGVVLNGRVPPITGEGPDTKVGNKTDSANELRMVVPLQGQTPFCVE
ncbi:hypothetical protein HGM15179_017364 [Zosterops borbonicus]|uniref:Uncharacterized protein n=1 Tax=Zosterops borbonicus TaxID=364589 RepID=A0A8K1LDD8_9PASS|nr:hypothetical protein HGM15179_017364 [Zosterops borbonicus]